QLTAIATYSDGTSSSVTNSVMWTPADANTATVTSTGLITGVGVGSTTMAVTKDGITSNTVNVTVSSAVITAIQVTPSQVNVAKGQT
ncbi:Ig-like domain-containing protein, partial [Vibrio anguillarum]|uniref:Ig-like domain-containing protein n=6 Tax=Vibrio TaxID=662 RepID=UPI00188CCBF2